MPHPTALAPTGLGDLLCQDGAGRRIHRVGFDPEPWAWTPWQNAEDGRFSGRWDDPDGVWRSIYVGESRLACYLEVLAFARADPQLQDELAGIEEAPEDAVAHRTLPAGLLPDSWRRPRRVGSAMVTGWYAVPGDKESLPTLRARFSRWRSSCGWLTSTPPRSGWPSHAGSPRRSRRGCTTRVPPVDGPWLVFSSAPVTVTG